jgi:hypothetical protein
MSGGKRPGPLNVRIRRARAQATAAATALALKTTVPAEATELQDVSNAPADLDPQLAMQNGWMRAVGAARRFASAYRLSSPAQHRARELCLDRSRLNQRLWRSSSLPDLALRYVLLKKRVGDDGGPAARLSMLIC